MMLTLEELLEERQVEPALRALALVKWGRDQEQSVRLWREKAWELHASVGQLYGETQPYGVHLDDVFVEALTHIRLLKGEADTDYMLGVLGAALFHDSIEDARYSCSDVAKIAGKSAADIVLAVTNVPGADRVDTALLTYPKIRKRKEAVYVKLCDRIANVRRSDNSIKKLKMYQKEQAMFKYALNLYDDLLPMWNELEELLP